MNKVYIAAPFFNAKQLTLVKAIEGELTDLAVEYYSPRVGGILMELSAEEKTQSKGQIYKDNVDQIDSCTHMIAVIDDRDVGTIWEMGYATAKGKTIASISNEDYGLNVMLAESVKAHIRSVDDIGAALFDEGFTGELVKDVY